MPFINDMLEERQRNEARQAALADENTAAPSTRPDSDANGLQTRFRFDVDAIAQHLRQHIVGQNQAVSMVIDRLRVVRADISDPRRPLLTALFLGPTGVGKTELVRTLAQALHGDPDALCRIDMNTLSQAHYAAALTGAPPGYVGSREGTTLLDQERIEGQHDRPGIVLLDEMEKASPEVLQALLNVFDNGMLTVASGTRTYSFRNALVFMTSNLGARDIQTHAQRRQRLPWRYLPTSAEQRRRQIQALVRRRLLAALAPEFVNRIDEICVFNGIEETAVDELIELELARLNRRLQKHRCQVMLAPSTQQHLARTGFDPQFGARALRRALRQWVEAPFAQYLLGDFTAADSETSVQSYLAVYQDGAVRFLPSPPAHSRT